MQHGQYISNPANAGNSSKDSGVAMNPTKVTKRIGYYIRLETKSDVKIRTAQPTVPKRSLIAHSCKTFPDTPFTSHVYLRVRKVLVFYRLNKLYRGFRNALKNLQYCLDRWRYRSVRELLKDYDNLFKKWLRSGRPGLAPERCDLYQRMRDAMVAPVRLSIAIFAKNGYIPNGYEAMDKVLSYPEEDQQENLSDYCADENQYDDYVLNPDAVDCVQSKSISDEAAVRSIEDYVPSKSILPRRTVAQVEDELAVYRRTHLRQLAKRNPGKAIPFTSSSLTRLDFSYELPHAGAKPLISE